MSSDLALILVIALQKLVIAKCTIIALVKHTNVIRLQLLVAVVTVIVQRYRHL